MTTYATLADLFTYGLPRGALVNPAQLVTANATTNAFTLDCHGLSSGDAMSFRFDADGSMPAPLVAGTEYYALPQNEYTFKVSATPSGAVIDLTTAGEFVLMIVPLPIAGALAWASLIVDQNLLAHCLPLAEPVHELVVATTAELAIGKLTAGSESKSLAALVAEASKRIATWSKGVPLRGENKPAAARAAGVAASATVPFRDPRGWGQFGGPT